MQNSRVHLLPILQACLVTFLWSTSVIIIKWGLVEIPPITYAGLRYLLASFCFLPIVMRQKHLAEIRQLNRLQWQQLILLGIVFYTFTQGTHFLGLSLLPSVTVSLMLNFTPLIVALMGVVWLQEKPSLRQWGGAFLFLAGVIVYFLPIATLGNQVIGLVVMGVGVLANALSAIMGRSINRNKNMSPVIITFVSMGVGALLLVIMGLALDGVPAISSTAWLYLIWLAVVNTTFAFTLWNITLRSLTAMESSIINSTMLIQIAILAWYFLGEAITLKEGVGLFIAVIGALLVQLKK